MAKYLVIVESPAKVKTIKKFLGSNYEVDASGGHVRDLPKSQMGIDVDNDYEPKYITIRGKGEVLSKLRKEVKKADVIYLATDPDREGEAISWHLMKALRLDEIPDKKVLRISFNEITKNAVKASLKEPRGLDMDLVNAQQARRILDRMVGYRISPLLWAKVKRGLSAGRVQSVALRMICDREEEIDAFIPEEYWEIEADFENPGDSGRGRARRKPLTARFSGTKNGKIVLRSREDVDRVLEKLKDCSYVVDEIRRGERIRKAPISFTTSTLQQEASKSLNFSTQKTMRLAQQLYEGVAVKGRGTIALITYLRTDSTRVAAEADASAREFIAGNYGEKYVAKGEPQTAAGANIQDAHEAIRPTDITLTPAQVKDSLQRDLFRLYQLIWRRFAASRMKPAVYATVNVKVKAGDYEFHLSASRMTFDGFMSIYTDEEESENSVGIPDSLTEGSRLELLELRESRHFTQPPAHYTEASLVKALEEEGIGRPSTYAPTITIILGRRYVIKENKNLYVTELGGIVNRIMKENFPSIVDLKFTANMEYLLDGVEDGTVDWKTVVRNFYPDLDEAVKQAEKELESVKVADEVSSEVCEMCGRNMVIKYGPHGMFLACPGFPECRNTKPYFEKTGVKCPKCGGDIIVRRTKKGRTFYGCSNAPGCDFMSWQKPSAIPCPKCGGLMVEKGKRLLCINPDCKSQISDSTNISK